MFGGRLTCAERRRLQRIGGVRLDVLPPLYMALLKETSPAP